MNVKMISVVLMLTLAGAFFVNSYASYSWEITPTTNSSRQDQLKKFNSSEEIKSFLEANTESRGYRGFIGMPLEMATPMIQKSMPPTTMMAESSASATSALSSDKIADDFSTTNIQVEGVDEADIVKNDGKYIYVLTGNKVSIIGAYPPEDAEILSTITIKSNPQELYISGDRLVVLGNDYRYIEYPDIQEKSKPSMVVPEEVEPYPRRMSFQTAVLYVYDISDRSSPELLREVFVDGNYFDSRMIGDYVYVIATQNARYYYDVIGILEITDLGRNTTIKPDVYYFEEPDYSYSFTTIVSVNTQNDNDNVKGKVYLLGATQNMFVSKNNVYITYQRMVPRPYLYERVIDVVLEPLLPKYVFTEIKRIQTSNKTDSAKGGEIEKVIMKYFNDLSEAGKKELEKVAQERMEVLEREISKETEKTVVHKISIEDGEIEYKTSGKVPGRVLNQFSMDEYEGFFRIATTTAHVSRTRGQVSANHIYVLDDDLEIVGELEDLAPGERIYSARFMGKRAYLVTFQKIDPLFVIDLSNPENPKVLGKLKIPGYSDYLHPYDENHIIGFGKDTFEAERGNFAWYQGIKLALFDVSDVEKPKEISKYVIGDRGTDSNALHDHKAFLFSREKNLLVIPVLLAEIDLEKYPGELPKWTHGDYVWQGAYVFDIDAEDGLRLKGRISHSETDDSFMKSGRYYHGSIYSIKRSLYMDDTLYTVSDGMVKMNGLQNLDEINKIYLPVSGAMYGIMK